MSSANDVVYCPLTFCYTNYGRMGQYEHLLTFTGIPGIRGSILGGTGFAVSSFSEHKQKAVEFGAWVCSASVQSGLYVQSMGQPGNITAWHNDQANALTNTFFRNTLPTLEQAYIRPQHHGFVPFQEEAGIKIHKFLRERTDAGECFDHLAQSYKEFKS
ncbi:MAG: carbohydrate ABC transporter substrate-binding protein, partial [Chloroflexota bacterium]